MPYSNDTFGHRLKVARVDKKMNQKELSQASGVDINSIARYELGETVPGLDKAYKIAMALGKSIDDLVDLPEPALRHST